VKFNGPLSQNQKDLVTQAGGAFATEDFLSLVRTAVAQKWIENGVMTDEK